MLDVTGCHLLGDDWSSLGNMDARSPGKHLSSLSANVPCPLNTGAQLSYVHYRGGAVDQNMSTSTWRADHVEMLSSPAAAPVRDPKAKVFGFVSIIFRRMKKEQREDFGRFVVNV